MYRDEQIARTMESKWKSGMEDTLQALYNNVLFLQEPDICRKKFCTSWNSELIHLKAVKVGRNTL